MIDKIRSDLAAAKQRLVIETNGLTVYRAEVSQGIARGEAMVNMLAGQVQTLEGLIRAHDEKEADEIRKLHCAIDEVEAKKALKKGEK